MRKLSVIVLIVVAFLAGSFTLTSASATNRGETIRLTAFSVQFEEIDLGDRGPSLGDQVVFNDRVFSHRRFVGVLNGVCSVTQLRRDSGTSHCVVTFSTRHGDITVQGVTRFSRNYSPDATLAVTGGTDRFRGASGEVHVHFATETRTDLKLVLD
jgi:hypothetical protein